MDPKQLENRFREISWSTKLVVVVHLCGLSADLDEIIKVCKEYQVTLVERCGRVFRYNI